MNRLEILRAQEFRGYKFTIRRQAGEIIGFSCDSIGLMFTNKLDTLLARIMFLTRNSKDAEELIKPKPLDDRYCDEDYAVTVSGNQFIYDGGICLHPDYYSAQEIEESLATYGFCLDDKLRILSIGSGFPSELFGVKSPNIVKSLLLTSNTLGKFCDYQKYIELYLQDMIDAGLRCGIDLEKIPGAYAGKADLVDDFTRMIVRDCDPFRLSSRFDDIDNFIDYGKYWQEILRYEYLHDEESGYFFNANW